MKKKNLPWILLIAGLLAVCGVLAFCLPRSTGTVAAVYSRGKLLRRIDLRAVTEPYRFRVETEQGFNEILVEPGRIRVESADCPDQICVRTGWAGENGLPAVCLPHGLVIRIMGSTPELDSVTG